MNESKQIVKIICKHNDCGVTFNIALPKKPGVYKVKCPNGHKNIVKFIPKETKAGGESVASDKPSPTEHIKSATLGKGKLTLVRYYGLLGGMGNKTFMLHLGNNTIGRYDEDLRCDIEIKGDTYASRRSVVIEVMDKQSGYMYKMTVLRAANPVMHNNRPLTVGEAVYLNFGDSIKLGNTVFNFEKA